MTRLDSLHALNVDDYAAADLNKIRRAMNQLSAELYAVVNGCAPAGEWQPTTSDPLQQLGEVDALLDRLYRAVGGVRRTLRNADEKARQNYLDRTAEPLAADASG
ncbi:hypothetical protein ACFV2X_48075 [Streptomyces sp. NPDC059679]|uniref:hypothetical protein n=1 Tax=Streptomyces sp. NPDC059679 TaxID=3346903 RepID=UPI0036B34F0B